LNLIGCIRDVIPSFIFIFLNLRNLIIYCLCNGFTFKDVTGGIGMIVAWEDIGMYALSRCKILGREISYISEHLRMRRTADTYRSGNKLFT